MQTLENKKMLPTNLLETLQRIIIVTGHYGTGKTNLSVNLAADFSSLGKKVLLVDLDIVNPYFRSADFLPLAENKGFSILSPPYANSNLDMPVLSAAVDAALAASTHNAEQIIILDVGGDDAGATALGRYASLIKEQGYSMLYVINQYRYLTREAESATAYLTDIEKASRLRATHVVNNSNLAYETSRETVERSLPFAKETAKKAGLPLLCTAIEQSLYNKDETNQLEEDEKYYPVSIYVKSPWS